MRIGDIAKVRKIVAAKSKRPEKVSRLTVYLFHGKPMGNASNARANANGTAAVRAQQRLMPKMLSAELGSAPRCVVR